MSDLKRLKETIILTSSYYNFNLRPEVLLMYVEDLSEYDEDEVIEAYKAYRKNPKHRQMPLPAQIIEILNPRVSDDQMAVDSASRVLEAVSKFGWCNSQDARDYIGELGWKSVQSFGGWQYVCENLGREISISTFNAQIREIAKTQIQKAKLGLSNGPIEIPYKDPDAILNDSKRNQIIQLADHLKKIEDVK